MLQLAGVQQSPRGRYTLHNCKRCLEGSSTQSTSILPPAGKTARGQKPKNVLCMYATSVSAHAELPHAGLRETIARISAGLRETVATESLRILGATQNVPTRAVSNRSHAWTITGDLRSHANQPLYFNILYDEYVGRLGWPHLCVVCTRRSVSNMHADKTDIRWHKASERLAQAVNKDKYRKCLLKTTKGPHHLQHAVATVRPVLKVIL